MINLAFQCLILFSSFFQNQLWFKYSTFELSDVFFYFLQLLLLGNEFLSNKGEIISTFVLFHDIKHNLQIFSKPSVIFSDFKFFFVLVNFGPDSILSER